MVSSTVLKQYGLNTGQEIVKKSYGISAVNNLQTSSFYITNAHKAFTEGFIKNIVVYRCIMLIANAAANLPIELKRKQRDGTVQEIPEHEMLTLLRNPNPWTSENSFINQSLINYLATGNLYIWGIRDIGLQPRNSLPLPQLLRKNINQLIVCPSNRVYLEEGTKDWFPRMYRYTQRTGSSYEFPVNQITGESELMVMKNYNPLNEMMGLSPLTPASAPVDNHNAGLEWNASLLENSSKPSGVLSTDHLFTDEQFNEMLERQQQYDQGPKNAGNTKLLEAGLKWMQTGLSPLDMDFKNSIEMAARNIGAAYNIPHQLIVKGESTYNNYEVAKESFYTEAVIPLLTRYLQELSRYLDVNNEGLYFVVNEDKIDALEPKRERRSNRISVMVKDGRITLNEAREMDGLEPYTVPEADMPLIQRSYMPLEDVDIEGALTNIRPPQENLQE